MTATSTPPQAAERTSSAPENVSTRAVIAILLVATFVVILNETIMNVALPRLMEDLSVTARTGQWLATVFMLTLAVVIPTTGFLLQRLSTRTAFVLALSFFSTGTLLAALANGYAAGLNFAGADSVKVVADRVRVSHAWMVPLGTLLASGAIGLVAGFAVPALGTAAAIGLVLYFICAVTAHLRAHDRQMGGAVFFLLLAAAALATGLAYRDG